MLNLLELLLIEITEKLHGGNIKSMLTFFLWICSWIVLPQDLLQHVFIFSSGQHYPLLTNGHIFTDC